MQGCKLSFRSFVLKSRGQTSSIVQIWRSPAVTIQMGTGGKGGRGRAFQAE